MRIAVVDPARNIERALAARVAAWTVLTFPEIELVFDEQCFAGEGHFVGTDDERAAAFLKVANDPSFDAVWFGRGGYGSNRILTRIMPQLGPAAGRKRYCGYSDIGFLLGALYTRRIGRVAHGPMAIDFGKDGGGAVTMARSLLWFMGKNDGVEPGLEGRPAAAFNLSILTALIGTPYLPDLTDHVLCIEDVSEPLYRIDRMLFTMAHATQLKGIAGVRLGGITDVQANDPPWRGSVDEMIRRWCQEMGVPFLGAARIEHGPDNWVVPFGIA